ncbi:MAG: hypothetical protein ACOX60_06475 [Massiliimalia sp.]|jgi:Txe/YoeB family toxin of Txe-Axe toxin-antitoxin module
MIEEDLFQRNQEILDTLIRRIQRDCPNAVDIIALGGSFLDGDFYEKSDLDLKIIVNDSKECSFSSCFLLGEVGFDLYAQTWDVWEEMAQFGTPYANSLAACRILYSRTLQCRERFEKLSRRFQEQLKMGFSIELGKKAKQEMEQAFAAFGKLCCEQELGKGRVLAAQVFSHCANALCYLNATFWKRGTKRRREELSQMEQLPQDFLFWVDEMPQSKDILLLRQSAEQMIQGVNRLLQKRMEEVSPHIVSPQRLKGTYEECWSNYVNKIRTAVSQKDAFFAYLAGCDCQMYLDEMKEWAGIPPMDLMKDFCPDHLEWLEQSLEQVLNIYEEQYRQNGLAPEQYDTVEAWKRAYLA